MALPVNAQQRMLWDTQQRIFNYLCSGFRRSRESRDFRVLLKNVKTELDIPQATLTEAIEKFIDATGERIVLVTAQNGEQYITLGETAKLNLTEWEDCRRPVVGFRSTITAEAKHGYRYAEAVSKNRW